MGFKHRQKLVVIGHSVRLVNGSTPWEGRVEVRYGDTWGTVCDDGFGVQEGAAVCKSLRFDSNDVKVVHAAAFGEGNGPVLLDEVRCTRGETDLLECRHLPIGLGDCTHTEDVGVICSQKRPIRLVNGSSASEGRVEVYRQGSWGTVCDEDFDDRDAVVVCRMMGFIQKDETVEVQVRSGASYGQGKGHIFYANLECRGTESDLVHCSHKVYDKHTCLHDRDVGVKCVTKQEPGELIGK
ncbi:scavenger receptor cysteine-rich type 1 protein M130-like [Littorina saxatilis]|uniref:SRCR domain-containing protein n=1 Tax=Littorina saxatilis TaxID=31220 RepID=A0AAN9BLH3_9CAEN